MSSVNLQQDDMSDFDVVKKNEKCVRPFSERKRFNFSREELYHLAGWVLFIVSSALYMWSGIQARSLSATLGALFFMLACFVFLVPILWKRDIFHVMEKQVPSPSQTTTLTE